MDPVNVLLKALIGAAVCGKLEFRRTKVPSSSSVLVSGKVILDVRNSKGGGDVDLNRIRLDDYNKNHMPGTVQYNTSRLGVYYPTVRYPGDQPAMFTSLASPKERTQTQELEQT